MILPTSVQDNPGIHAQSAYSVNLAVLDRRYRALYIDRVENQLDAEQQMDLFGEWFTAATKAYNDYVVAVVTGFTVDDADALIRAGFVPRLLKRGAHGCVILSNEAFASSDTGELALRLIRLIHLQQALA